MDMTFIYNYCKVPRFERADISLSHKGALYDKVYYGSWLWINYI